MLPALFIVFAVARGAKLIAGEGDTGTLEVVIVTPVSRLRLLVNERSPASRS
jgi:ABC-2 type transport system permease protein